MSEIKTKRHHVTREEEADRDLNGTQFSKGSAAMVALFFLLFVFGIPAVQHVVEIRANLAKRAAWDPKSGQPEPQLAPKIYDVFALFPSREQIAAAKGFWGYWSLIPSTEKINEFEKELKDQGVLSQALLSPAQLVLTGTLGAGNELAYVGQPGWLFYRPDIEYLTGDAFLDPKSLRIRSHQSEAQPNPVTAIVDFARQLKERNIELVIVPMPTKPMIETERLVGDKGKGERLQNPSFNQFVQEVQGAGVKVYDPTELLLSRKESTGQPQYLETDTHWTPEAMSAVSKDLAAFVTKSCALPPERGSGYQVKPITISNLGDIAEMLKLPKDQQIYKKQTVQTEQVQHDGEPWMSDRKGDVLLLGDSFSNIYSMDGLNWGTASGFAEHLSLELGRPVDKIAINAGGSFQTRKDLARQMAQGDRLAGKKVVVYEFSMRDLNQGDWKIIEMPKPPKMAEPAPIDTHPTPTPPTPTVKLTPLAITEIVPPVIDPAKKQSVSIKLSVPKGDWSAAIKDADGKVVRQLGKGTEKDDAKAEVHWDGKAEGGAAVKPGPYTVSITGQRPDKTPIDEVTGPVLVSGDEPKIQAIGATPAKIDTLAHQTTVADFNVPQADRYQADVYSADGRKYRVIGRQQGGPGVVHVPWDGKDRTGKPAADGTYTVRLTPVTHGKVDLQFAEVKVNVKSVTKTTPATTPKNNDGKTGTKTGEQGTSNPPAEQGLTVTGKITARGDAPKAGTYKDAVLALSLTDLKVTGGKIDNANIVVYVWGMRDNKPVDGAYQVGQTVTFRLIPWAGKGEAKYGSYNRLELNTDDWYSWPTFWGEAK